MIFLGNFLQMPKPKLPCFFALLFILVSSGVGAQKYFPGYIIQQGDTIRGEVDYRKWDSNPSKILFKSNEAENYYDVNDIEGFGIDGYDRYRTRTVIMDMNPVEMTQLHKKIRDSISVGKHFLRLLVDGKSVDLYEIQNFKAHYFIEKVTGSAEELRYALLYDEGTARVFVMNHFHDQLKSLLSGRADSSGKASKISNLRYQAGELTRFISTLDEGGPNFIPFDQVNEKTEVQFFAGGGASFGQLKFTGDFYPELEAIVFNLTTSYIFSAGVDIYPSRSKTFFVRAALVASAFSGSGEGFYKSQGAVGQGSDNSYELEQTNIGPAFSLNTLIARGEKVSAYLGLGYRYHFSETKTKFTSVNRLTNETTIVYNQPQTEKNFGRVNLRFGLLILNHIEFATSLSLSGTFYTVKQSEKSKPATVQIFYRFGK